MNTWFTSDHHFGHHNIIGHVHHHWKVSGRQINFSVENWDFKPVGLGDIAAIIEAGVESFTQGEAS